MEYSMIYESGILGAVVPVETPYAELGGRYFPVIGLIRSKGSGGLIPVLELPMREETPEEGEE